MSEDNKPRDNDQAYYYSAQLGEFLFRWAQARYVLSIKRNFRAPLSPTSRGSPAAKSTAAETAAAKSTAAETAGEYTASPTAASIP